MVVVNPNANFYSLNGFSDPEEMSAEYQEYRKSWIEYPIALKLRDFPMHLDIEATNRCNLRCTFCDKLPYLRKDQIGDMNMNLYKKIIDEGMERKLWGVKLSYRGEPLLHKSIVEMVEYAKMKGILDIYFNTNGMLLNETMSARLIDAHLDRVSISVEGTDPVLFEKERKGAKFDVIVRNVNTLIELREKKNVKYPKVRIQTVYFPNLDLEAYRDYWLNHCDEVAAVDYKDAGCREKGIIGQWACPQLWQRMTIEWDGTVLACNNDDLRLLSVGNANEKSIYDCWHDLNVQKIRNLHKQGNSHLVAACDGCPWRTAQLMKLV